VGPVSMGQGSLSSGSRCSSVWDLIESLRYSCLTDEEKAIYITKKTLQSYLASCDNGTQPWLPASAKQVPYMAQPNHGKLHPTVIGQPVLQQHEHLRKPVQEEHKTYTLLVPSEVSVSPEKATQRAERSPVKAGVPHRLSSTRAKVGCSVWQCGRSAVYDPAADLLYNNAASDLLGQTTHVAGVQEVPAKPPRLVPRAVAFCDFRAATFGQNVGLVGFYFDEIWDSMCGAGFCGSHWPLNPRDLEVEARASPGVRKRFTNAEAAFQALKFWNFANEFQDLTGEQALQKKRQLVGRQDYNFAGFGSNWRGMWAVLQAKFQPGSRMAEALISTGDAFLLHHNSASGRDTVWSDNCDGEGTNWLGLQLLLLRDQLTGLTDWTDFLVSLVDRDSGKPLGYQARHTWQDIVRLAGRALMAAVVAYQRSLPDVHGVGAQQSDWL